MYRLLAVDLLSDVGKPINRENISRIAEIAGHSCTNEEIDQVIECLALDQNSLEDWVAKGLKEIRPESAPAQVSEEKTKEIKEEPKAEEEEDDGFDIFSGL